MVSTRQVLSALGSAAVAVSGFASVAVANVAEGTPAATPAPSPRLDAVLQSLHESTQGKGISLPMLPLCLIAVSIVLMVVAVKQWNRRRANPRPLNDQRRLLDEAARAAGMSKRKLKRIAPLAAAEGLNSPLVAMLCPSAIKRLAEHVKTGEEQEALKSVAESLFRAEKHGQTVR